MKNSELAKIFFEMANLFEMKKVAFKPRAYQRAANVIRDLGEELEDIYKRDGLGALLKVPGVGQAIAEKIAELLDTGRLEYYEKLKKDIPVNLSALSAIEGLGPRRVKSLYEKLGVRTVDDLEKAAGAGKVSSTRARLPS